jgi:hypothetical protein
MDSSISGSEMFYSYGYDDNAGNTTAAAETFLRSVSSGSVEIGQHSESTVVSNPGVLVANVPFSVTGNTAAVTNPAGAPDDVVQTVFAYGLQRDQATQNQRLSVGGNNMTSYELGDYKDQSGHDYNGVTAEVIHYPAQLNGTERMKVESYLAIKYGLTLANADQNTNENDVTTGAVIAPSEGDYLSSAGTVIWDGDDTSVATGSFTGGHTKNVSTENTNVSSLRFNTAVTAGCPSLGSCMFTTGSTATAEVNQYTLSTPYTVSTATFTTNFAVNTQEASPFALEFSADGTKMYIAGTGNTVYQYTLPTPFSLVGATYASKSFGLQGSTTNGLKFNNSGTRLFNTVSGDIVYQYDLATAYDISTAVYNSVNFDA